MNFQIGQKVVCVNNKGIESENDPLGGEPCKAPPVKVGSIYIVLDVLFCFKCGEQHIHIGYHSEPDSYMWCEKCRHIIEAISDTQRYWLESWRFVPVEEYEASENMVEELLEPLKQETI